jgi:hypothetical protein
MNRVNLMKAVGYPVRTILHIGVFASLLLVCLWPAILSGYPLFGTDTLAYIRYADIGVTKVTGHKSDWATPAIAVTPVAPQASPETTGDANVRAPFAGRSIYYGALLELGVIVGSMWVSIAVQAAALMLAIALILHSTVGYDRLAFTGLIIALSLTTPVAIYVSFLSPDLFAGLTILAVAALLVYGERMSRGVLLAWIGLLCSALLFHSSHVLIAMAALGTYLMVRFLFRVTASLKGLIAIAFCLVIALTGEAMFTLAVTKMFGVSPMRPPFLTARLLADGPGAAFLRDSCPQSGFIACHFVDTLPVATAGDFLWSSDPKIGVFTPADPATRRALADEQYHFAYAVLRYDPVGVAVAALHNTLMQFGMLRVNEFNLSEGDRDALSHSVPPSHLRVLEETRSWANTLPLGLMSAIVLVVVLGSMVYVLGALILRNQRSDRDHDLRRLAVVIIFGIVVNAFVCGAMSEPYDRYQARVIWLIPLLAALMCQRRWLRRIETTSARVESVERPESDRPRTRKA